MSNNKLGQEPAFPSTEYKYTGDGCHNWVAEPGMSKRLYIATMAMQGILASAHFNLYSQLDRDKCAEIAYEIADELLKNE